MKIHLLALLGLAIGSALPSFGQQKDAGDPKMAEQFLRARVRADQRLRLVDLGTGVRSIGTVAECDLVVRRVVADPVARLLDRGQ